MTFENHFGKTAEFIKCVANALLKKLVFSIMLDKIT